MNVALMGCGFILMAATSLYSARAEAAAPLLGSDQGSPRRCSTPRQTLQLTDAFSSGAESQDAEAHYARGLKFQAQGKDADAENEFRAAWAGHPQTEQFTRSLALLYIERGQYDQALAVIRDHVKLCGATALGYALEAELLFHRKLYHSALEAAQRSLAIDGHNARMHELAGLVCVADRQNGAALTELKTAADEEPANPQIRYYYGRVLYSTGRYAEALDQFISCLKLQPDYPRALDNLGLSYEALQNYPKAIEIYKKAIVLDRPKTAVHDVEPYAYYAVLLAKTGQYELSLSLLREAVRLSPRSFRANYELGRILLKTNDSAQAEKYLMNAANLAPNFSDTYYLLGQLYQKQHRPVEAKDYFGKFKELNQIAGNREFPLTDR